MAVGGKRTYRERVLGGSILARIVIALPYKRPCPLLVLLDCPLPPPSAGGFLLVLLNTLHDLWAQALVKRHPIVHLRGGFSMLLHRT